MEDWNDSVFYDASGPWMQTYIENSEVREFEVGGKVTLSLSPRVWKGIRKAVKSDPRFDSNTSLVRFLVGRGLTAYQEEMEY